MPRKWTADNHYNFEAAKTRYCLPKEKDAALLKVGSIVVIQSDVS